MTENEGLNALQNGGFFVAAKKNESFYIHSGLTLLVHLTEVLRGVHRVFVTVELKIVFSGRDIKYIYIRCGLLMYRKILV